MRSVATWTCALVLALLMVAATSAVAQVTGWRGDGSGKVPDATPPLEWSDKKNVLWSAQVGKSYSSPIVVGDKILVTSEPDRLLCLDRSNGKVIWEKSNGFDQLPPALKAKDQELQTSCGYATPTPVSDGKHVWVLFGTGIVACYDLDGERKWITFIEQAPISPYGRSASPLLVGDKLIVPVSHMVGLDAATGKIAWDQPDAEAGYGTPAVVAVDKQTLVVTPGGQVVKPEDGKVMADDLCTLAYASPVVDKDVIYFIGTDSRAVKLSLRPDGKVEAKELWEQQLDGEYFASPVVQDGLVYTCNSVAEYSVLNATDGTKELGKTLELPPAGNPGGGGALVYPSLVLAGAKLFVSNTAGNTFVLEPGKGYKEVGRNEIGEELSTAPVFVDKQALLRSGEKLICVGAK